MEKAKELALEYMNANPHSWKIFARRNQIIPFLIERSQEVNDLKDEIDKHSGGIHSGASLALVMRYLEYIHGQRKSE
jgi:hypothetical protein